MIGGGFGVGGLFCFLENDLFYYFISYLFEGYYLKSVFVDVFFVPEGEVFCFGDVGD